MKKRIILICLAVLVCLSGVVVRIWYVNKDREERVIKIYPMGEMAPFEDDFYYRSDEIRDQYEIRVNSAIAMPVEEYLKSKGLTKEEVWPDVNNITDILDVNVTIRNNTSSDVDVEDDEQFFDFFNAEIENEGNMAIFIHTERIMLSDFYKFPIHDPFLYFSFRFRNF